MRSHTGGLWAKILLGLLVLSFGVWGVEDMLRTGGNNAAVATVGGESLSQPEFAASLRGEAERLRRMLGDNAPADLAKSPILVRQTVQKMINTRLLRMEAQRIGLTPSDQDVAETIRDNPAFQNESGRFDKALFQAALRNAELGEKAYVDEIKREMGSDLIVETISAAAPVPDEAVKLLYSLREEARGFDLITLPISAVKEPAKPTPEEIDAYYQAHAREFTMPERRTLVYVTLTPSDVAAKAAPNEADILAAYKDRIDDYKKPELRDVEQMLFDSEEKANKAIEQLKSGKPFLDVAKASDVQNPKALSLGRIERGGLIEQAQAEVFSLKSGEHTAPIQSPFGWHIFHVRSIEPAATRPLDEVREQIARDLTAHAGDDALTKLANTLEDAIAGGATLQEAAKEQGLSVLTLGPVTRDGAPKALPGLVEAGFKLEERTESTLTQSSPGVYFIVRADQITPEQTKPLEEVKAQVTAGLAKDRKFRAASKEGEALAEKLRAAKDIAIAAREAGASIASHARLKRAALQNPENKALPAALMAELFSLPKDKPSRAYAMDNGDQVIAVVRSIEPGVAPKDADDKTLADIRKSLDAAMQNELLTQYFQALRARYGVEVNEAALARFTGEEP